MMMAMMMILMMMLMMMVMMIMMMMMMMMIKLDGLMTVLTVSCLLLQFVNILISI